MHTYAMAADSEKLVESRAFLRRGEVVNPVERRPGALVHALDASGTGTLCGREATALHRFGQLTYEQTNPLLRCPVCDKSAG
jgi:hypothetical protein